MSRRRHFDMVLVYDGESVRVTGSVSPGYPERVPSYDCGGTPAEPPEVEDLRIYAEDGTEIEDADGDIFEALQDDILERVSEDDAADQCEAAEHRHDAERDQ